MRGGDPISGLIDDDIRQYMATAYEHAAFWSHDRRTHNAAVIVSDYNGTAYGSNRFPHPLKEYPDDETKNRLIIHAEEMAIFEAAEAGIRTYGATMICPWAACTRCARAIIGAGIAHLITHKSMMDRTYEKYRAEIAEGLAMLKRAGVKHTNWEGRIGDGVTNLMNGETWDP